MSLRKRLDRLSPKPHGPMTVFLTSYELKNGGAELHRALIAWGHGNTRQLIREAGESEVGFRARVNAARAAMGDTQS